MYRISLRRVIFFISDYHNALSGQIHHRHTEFCDFCAVHFFDTKMQPVTIRLYQLLLSCRNHFLSARELWSLFENHSCNLHSTLCDIFHPEYPAFDNVPELVRYIGQLELMSEKMATNEALHSAPFDQFTSDTDRVFDSQEHNLNSSKKALCKWKIIIIYRPQRILRRSHLTFEEIPTNIFSQIIADSLLNGRPLPIMLQLLPMMYRHRAHASCSLQGGSFPRIWFGILMPWQHSTGKRILACIQ